MGFLEDLCGNSSATEARLRQEQRLTELQKILDCRPIPTPQIKYKHCQICGYVMMKQTRDGPTECPNVNCPPRKYVESRVIENITGEDVTEKAK